MRRAARVAVFGAEALREAVATCGFEPADEGVVAVVDATDSAAMARASALAYEVEVARTQGAPIDVIYPTDGIAWTFESNALVRGAKNPANARRFLDWAVSKSAMTAYAAWRGAGITRPDVPMGGQKILDMGIQLGFLKVRTPMSELMDKSFFPQEIKPAQIDLSRMQEIIKQE